MNFFSQRKNTKQVKITMACGLDYESTISLLLAPSAGDVSRCPACGELEEILKIEDATTVGSEGSPEWAIAQELIQPLQS